MKPVQGRHVVPASSCRERVPFSKSAKLQSKSYSVKLPLQCKTLYEKVSFFLHKASYYRYKEGTKGVFVKNKI